MSWSGLIELDDVAIHAKGIEGPASRIVLLDSTTVQIANWLPWQQRHVRSIQTDNITIRIAESELVAGEFNFSSLLASGFPESEESITHQQTSAHVPLLTDVDLKMLTVEIGTMHQSSWEISETVKFEVQLSAIEDSSYGVSLQNEEETIRIEGFCNLATLDFELDVEPMQLDDRLFSLLPKTIRLWCEAIGLQGDTGELSITWDGDNGLRVEVDIDVIEFNLHEVHTLQWVHYEDGNISRMRGSSSLRVDEGRIVFDGNSAVLQNLRGVLLPPQSSEDSSEIPFQATLKFYDLPSHSNGDGNQWMETMLDKSPFSAFFQIDGFQSKKEGAGQVDLPLAAARILQLFHMKDWNVNAELIMSREKLGGEIALNGKLAINDGTGSYDGFPYPLREVNALIDVSGDSLLIQSFHAKGSEDSSVSIHGEVNTTGEQVRVQLELNVMNAPLDKALHEAVPKPVASVMDRLLDQDSLDQLKLRGLVEDEDYELGGFVDMDLSITHSGKVGESVKVSGDLEFKSTNIVHSGFPCPIIVSSGKIRLEPDRLEIPKDQPIQFRGPGGGHGEIDGIIKFDRNGNTQPFLKFSLFDERITDSIVEAVAISSGDSFSVVDGVLGGLGLNGTLSAFGAVVTTSEGTIEKDIYVAIQKSTAELQPKLAKAIHATKSFWPEGFALTDVVASVHVHNDGVEVSDVTARLGDGELSISMNIFGGDYDLQLKGTKWPISSNLVYLLPPNASEQLAESWHVLEPSGFLNAELRMSHQDGKSDLHFKAVPIELGISSNRKKVVMRCEDGDIVVNNASVYLNTLTFSLDQDGESHGNVRIDGNVHVVNDDTEFDITGTWKDATASSPLTRAITRIIGGEDAVGYYDSLSPNGSGFVTLNTSSSGNQSMYKVVIVPEKLSAEFGERRAFAQFENGKSDEISRIIFNNEGVQLDHLHGKLGDGKFAIEGSIRTKDRIKGSFQLDWNGPADDQSLFAVLPSVVGDTLVAMEIGEGTSKVEKGDVSLSGPHWRELEIDFEGDIQLHDVSMNAGIPLSNIYGSTVVEGIYDEERLTSLQLLLKLDKMTALGREISRIEGGLILDPVDTRMKFQGVRGHSSSGVVTISGWVGVDDSKKYEVTVFLAGVMLEDDGSEKDVEGTTFKGEMTGWISVAGVRGEISTRYGIGELRVTKGMFAEVPVSMRAMQLLHLTLPTTESITTVLVDLYIDGDDIVLERIKLTGDDTSAQGLVFKGSGKIRVPSFELDLRLHPRAGWPLVREITGAVGDQLLSIDVTGKFLDPTITVVPLPFLSPID